MEMKTPERSREVEQTLADASRIREDLINSSNRLDKRRRQTEELIVRREAELMASWLERNRDLEAKLLDIKAKENRVKENSKRILERFKAKELKLQQDQAKLDDRNKAIDKAKDLLRKEKEGLRETRAKVTQAELKAAQTLKDLTTQTIALRTKQSQVKNQKKESEEKRAREKIRERLRKEENKRTEKLEEARRTFEAERKQVRDAHAAGTKKLVEWGKRIATNQKRITLTASKHESEIRAWAERLKCQEADLTSKSKAEEFKKQAENKELLIKLKEKSGLVVQLNNKLKVTLSQLSRKKKEAESLETRLGEGRARAESQRRQLEASRAENLALGEQLKLSKDSEKAARERSRSLEEEIRDAKERARRKESLADEIQLLVQSLKLENSKAADQLALSKEKVSTLRERIRNLEDSKLQMSRRLEEKEKASVEASRLLELSKSECAAVKQQLHAKTITAREESVRDFERGVRDLQDSASRERAKLAERRSLAQDSEMDALKAQLDLQEASTQKKLREKDELYHELERAEREAKAEAHALSERLIEAAATNATAQERIQLKDTLFIEVQSRVESLRREIETLRNQTSRNTLPKKPSDPIQSSPPIPRIKSTAQDAAVMASEAASPACESKIDERLKSSRAQCAMLSSKLRHMATEATMAHRRILDRDVLVLSAEKTTKSLRKQMAQLQADNKKLTSEAKKLNSILNSAREELATALSEARTLASERNSLRQRLEAKHTTRAFGTQTENFGSQTVTVGIQTTDPKEIVNVEIGVHAEVSTGTQVKSKSGVETTEGDKKATGVDEVDHEQPTQPEQLLQLPHALDEDRLTSVFLNIHGDDLQADTVTAPLQPKALDFSHVDSDSNQEDHKEIDQKTDFGNLPPTPPEQSFIAMNKDMSTGMVGKTGGFLRPTGPTGEEDKVSLEGSAVVDEDEKSREVDLSSGCFLPSFLRVVRDDLEDEKTKTGSRRDGYCKWILSLDLKVFEAAANEYGTCDEEGKLKGLLHALKMPSGRVKVPQPINRARRLVVEMGDSDAAFIVATAVRYYDNPYQLESAHVRIDKMSFACTEPELQNGVYVRDDFGYFKAEGICVALSSQRSCKEFYTKALPSTPNPPNILENKIMRKTPSQLPVIDLVTPSPLPPPLLPRESSNRSSLILEDSSNPPEPPPSPPPGVPWAAGLSDTESVLWTAESVEIGNDDPDDSVDISSMIRQDGCLQSTPAAQIPLRAILRVAGIRLASLIAQSNSQAIDPNPTTLTIPNANINQTLVKYSQTLKQLDKQLGSICMDNSRILRHLRQLHNGSLSPTAPECSGEEKKTLISDQLRLQRSWHKRMKGSVMAILRAESEIGSSPLHDIENTNQNALTPNQPEHLGDFRPQASISDKTRSTKKKAGCRSLKMWKRKRYSGERGTVYGTGRPPRSAPGPRRNKNLRKGITEQQSSSRGLSVPLGESLDRRESSRVRGDPVYRAALGIIRESLA